MNLIIDIGNTNIKFIYLKDDNFNTTIYLLSKTSNITKYLRSKNKLNVKIDNIIYSSVVKRTLTTSIIKEFTSFYKVKAININSIKYELSMDIKEKRSNVGIDLIADIIASNKLYKGNKIIIDLGTVNKILLVKNNKFIGASFFPSFEVSKLALIGSADNLKKSDNKIIDITYGKDTKSCINSGIYNSIYFTINGLINEYKKELGKSSQVILCGNGSKIYKDKFKFDYVPQLTLIGIYLIYKGRQK